MSTPNDAAQSAIIYTTEDISKRCKITRRQAQNLCRRLLGGRVTYRLTQDDFDRVLHWHAFNGYCTKKPFQSGDGVAAR